MPFKPEPLQPDFERIITVLNNARIQDTNNALYQTITMLIQKMKTFQKLTNSEIADINTILEASGGGSSVVSGESGYPNALGHAKI